jgi:HAD superfamily hydrolase (TIGR01509 family)
MVGGGVDELIRQALNKFKATTDHEAVKREYLKYYSEHATVFTTPYEGAINTLETLDGYKKAIVSNKKTIVCREVLNNLDMRKYFDVVICSDSMDHMKPSPIPFTSAMSTMNVKPAETLVVGDTAMDILAGKLANIRTVAATYGYGKPGFQYEADFTITDISQIHRIIRSI